MKGIILISCILISCVVFLVGATPPTYSVELESALRNELFTGYERLQRPEKRVLTWVELTLLSLNYLNIKEQTLSATAYIRMQWRDSRLAWNLNSNYTNVNFIFSNEKYVWTPAVTVQNSVDDVDVISKPQVIMRITSLGTVIWTPGGVYTTSCEMDVTYYPLDIQTCSIVISTWGYTESEIGLSVGQGGIDMEYFSRHGEWEILETSTSSSLDSRGINDFSKLLFTIKFRRRPLFHMVNTLFPVILMGFLTVVIFKLPAESGEKIGLSLTILLAYAVYLTLISEDIPQTSLSASILSSYLAIILLLQTLAVFLVVIYLDLYFKPEDEPVPQWLQNFATRMTTCPCKRKDTIEQLRPSPDSKDGLGNIKVVKGNGVMNLSYLDNKATARKETEETGSVWTADHDDNAKFTWKEISALLERITMYIYLFLITSLTLICLSVIASSYSKTA